MKTMAAYKTLLSGIDAALHGKAVPTEAVESVAVREHILVVDDDKMNLKIAERLLKNAYDVSCVPSGEEALGFLKSNRPDMILLDLHMPGMDGFDVLNAGVVPPQAQTGGGGPQADENGGRAPREDGAPFRRGCALPFQGDRRQG